MQRIHQNEEVALGVEKNVGKSQLNSLVCDMPLDTKFVSIFLFSIILRYGTQSL